MSHTSLLEAIKSNPEAAAVFLENAATQEMKRELAEARRLNEALARKLAKANANEESRYPAMNEVGYFDVLKGNNLSRVWFKRVPTSDDSQTKYGESGDTGRGKRPGSLLCLNSMHLGYPMNQWGIKWVDIAQYKPKYPHGSGENGESSQALLMFGPNAMFDWIAFKREEDTKKAKQAAEKGVYTVSSVVPAAVRERLESAIESDARMRADEETVKDTVNISASEPAGKQLSVDK